MTDMMTLAAAIAADSSLRHRVQRITDTERANIHVLLGLFHAAYQKADPHRDLPNELRYVALCTDELDFIRRRYPDASPLTIALVREASVVGEDEDQEAADQRAVFTIDWLRAQYGADVSN